MDESVTAADANRKFSQLLRGVREGRSFVVTSHGQPVARLVPVGSDEKVADGAKAALLKRLKAQPVMDIGRWSREELYENDE